MTKTRPSYFIYLLIFVLLLLAASLYVWREDVTTYFFSRSLKVNNNALAAADNRSEVISLDILRDPRVKSLTSQTKLFNYYDLVKSQDLIIEQSPVISLPPTEEGGAPVTIMPSRVRVGNSNPFVKKDRR